MFSNCVYIILVTKECLKLKFECSPNVEVTRFERNLWNIPPHSMKKKEKTLTERRPKATLCLPRDEVDSGDGLPVSAEPGLTHDILVSRTSVRPKACNKVTGRCKGGGLESPPANKLLISTPGEWKFSQKLTGLEACNLLMGFKFFFAYYSNRKESPDSGGKPGTVAQGRTGLQESYRLPKRKRNRMTICTYNTRTLVSEAAIEDLMTQGDQV
ncbi:hypothetical protein RB195_022914 [Necator americanus]|uniref:Uncharacterized protein n=1 Tax=Necator americanus TaxID=51031 RepID=A0ABR1EH31_NECAM